MLLVLNIQTKETKMRRKLSKLALAVSFGLALAFTFSCSSDDSGGRAIPSSSSGTIVQSSSSKAVVPSSSSKAVVQEYCIYKANSTSAVLGWCGVIEPIGSSVSCSVGTKKDSCPYGYDLINLDLLNACVKQCCSTGNNCSGGGSSCSKCGGSINSNNGTCSARRMFCNGAGKPIT